MRTDIPLREITNAELWQEIQNLRTELQTHNHLGTGSIPLNGIINGDLQSGNFIAGSSGWQVKQNGDVYFNNGTFAGTLSAVTGTFASLYTNSAEAITIDYGGSILLKHGGNVQFTSVTKPTACTATLITTAGNVDVGTHTYKVTYVNATGETELGTASNTVTTDANNKQVALSAIPVSTSVSVTARKIYRTKAGGSDYYFLTTISNNTTTTYTDNIADASLTGEIANYKENNTFGKIIIDGVGGLSLGSNNTFVGQQSGSSVTIGNYNSALGVQSLYSTTTGSRNTAMGIVALFSNTTGHENTVIGHYVLYSNTTGYYNSAVGSHAGRSITTGNSNTFLGYEAGYHASQKVDAVNSMALGYGAYTTKSNQIVIGNTSIEEVIIADNNNALTLLKGRIGVGTTPNASTILDLYSITQALVLTRMTTAQRDAMTNPVSGMIIYNLTTAKLNVRVAAAWEAITSA